MREWLEVFTGYAVTIIDAMAMLLIIVGTVEAFISVFTGWSKSNQEKREVWLRFARWLVAGLTFQLAADVLETSFQTSWTAIGQLAAIAVIRTFLNYFLEKDLADVRQREKESIRK
jgi:uncharacterized membrane protein